MSDTNFKFFLQDDSGRYSSTWTVSTIDNNIHVIATCVGGTTKVSIYPTGECEESSDLYLRGESLPLHVPPLKSQRWYKRQVASGLFRLLDVHMPHHLLSGNDRFRPSGGYKLPPVLGYGVTSVGIFESLYDRGKLGWRLKSCKYDCLHSHRLPDGRYLYVVVYGSSHDFPDCPAGDDEFYSDELSRLIKPYHNPRTRVGCYVDTIFSTASLMSLVTQVLEVLSRGEFE